MPNAMLGKNCITNECGEINDRSTLRRWLRELENGGQIEGSTGHERAMSIQCGTNTHLVASTDRMETCHAITTCQTCYTNEVCVASSPTGGALDNPLFGGFFYASLEACDIFATMLETHWAN